jgi:DNA (cytosine-5)-methyltransferase 1
VIIENNNDLKSVIVYSDIMNFLEFFAGGGMVRYGLGPEWNCLLANDFSEKKAKSYIDNWGGADLRVGDINELKGNDLPNVSIDLAWGSSPCQDLSMAGNQAGLAGKKSSAFYGFVNLMKECRPKIICVENVVGALVSNDGDDFRIMVNSFIDMNYKVGTLVINAYHFVPQSRNRIFIICVRDDVEIPQELIRDNPIKWASTKTLASFEMPMINWNIPEPPYRTLKLADIIEKDAPASLDDVKRVDPLNRNKIEHMLFMNKFFVGTGYFSTKIRNGEKKVMLDIRVDGIAGCLRTPGGGSSIQTVLIAEDGVLKTRVITARETARLMGLPDSYILPSNYYEAYHLTGDGVVVPVVRYLAEKIFEPILKNNS